MGVSDFFSKILWRNFLIVNSAVSQCSQILTETVPIASRLVLWHGLGPSICAALIPSALHAVSFESRQVVSGVRVISALRAGGPVVRWFIVLHINTTRIIWPDNTSPPPLHVTGGVEVDDTSQRLARWPTYPSRLRSRLEAHDSTHRPPAAAHRAAHRAPQRDDRWSG